MEINSRYSVPVGTYETNFNSDFELLDPHGSSSGDSLYYNDSLFPIDKNFIDFAFNDTFNFNIIKGPSGIVKSVEFVILVNNGYPTQAVLQIYFMATYLRADSAFLSGPRVINPGVLNSEELVGDPSTTMITVAMPADFNDKVNLINAISVKGRLYLTRPDIRLVKFLPQYKFNVHIGARIEVLHNTNEL
jgi:hypothetical protein